MAAVRRRGRLLLSLLVCLLLALAVGGALFGPVIAAAINKRGGIVAVSKRKFERLRQFALFRSPGDKAVLRFGEPAAKSRAKRPLDN